MVLLMRECSACLYVYSICTRMCLMVFLYCYRKCVIGLVEVNGATGV